MTQQTETGSQESDAEPDRLFAVLADPMRLPQWAPGFADEVTGSAAAGWQRIKDGGTFPVRVAADPLRRTVDFLREVAPGRDGGAYLRILPRPLGGSVVVMTLPVPGGADPRAVAAILRDELARLVRLCE